MKKVLALLAAIIMATPAFAAVQNVKVSGDIDSTYIARNHFNLGQKAANGIENGLVEQRDFVTQTRLRVDADLSDNVSTTVGLINERAWDAEGTTDTNVQLYLAYATMREFLYSPLTVSVGRQVFAYGNGFIIGDGGVNNQATGNLSTVAADLTKRSTFDGVKAILDYKPLTVDLFFFRNNSNTTNGGVLSRSRDNDDVYGINTNYQLGDTFNTVVEGYFIGRRNGNQFNTNDENGTIYVPGLRVSTNPLKGLNTQAEIAWQRGNRATAPGVVGGANVQREALAYQLLASYELPVAQLEKYKPVASASFTHVSGDTNADLTTANIAGGNNSGETYTAWDPMFEAQGGGTIYNTLFDLTNMNIFSAGLSAKPLEDVTAKFTWSGLYADKRNIAGVNTLTFRSPDGNAVTPAYNTRKDMGNEYDVNVDYAYTEDVTLGVSLGWYVPGKMFTSANDTTASQALAHVLVNF